MIFSVLCFFLKPASWHLLLYQYRSIHFDTHISKQHSPIKSRVPCAPFILWAPAPPKVSARPWSVGTHTHTAKAGMIFLSTCSSIQMLDSCGNYAGIFLYWLHSNHGMMHWQSAGQKHGVWNDVSVSYGKQASTHSLKCSRLGFRCVLTSWEQIGTISHELTAFVPV